MYITHNNQTYANVRVYSTSGSVRFTGDSLSGVTDRDRSGHGLCGQ